MKFQNRLLLAQLAPLVPLLLTGLLAVAALWTMTSSVQQARALQVRRMVTAAETVGTFREEYALLERYADTGDDYYLEEARLRSQLVHTRIEVLSPDPEQLEQLSLLLGEYEALAGFSGPPGDREEAQRAARAMVQELEARHREFRIAMQDDLRTVAQTGRTTGAFIIFMVGLVLVLGGWISYVVARDLSGAMRELERGTQALTAGDFEYRIELERQDEFGDLASAFDRMAGRIAELDRMKIDFFANVSHDLKTPLTSMSEATALLSEEVAAPLSPDQEHRGGTGLGLYICREIVDTHGGRIWVEEAEGGGARFCFTLVPGQALPV